MVSQMLQHSLRPLLPTNRPAYKTFDWKTACLALAFSRYLQLFQVLQDLVQPSCGLALGCSRAVAAEFDVLLAIPTMAGRFCIEMYATS